MGVFGWKFRRQQGIFINSATEAARLNPRVVVRMTDGLVSLTMS